MVAKSCTNWYVVYPPICRVSTIQGGAWFRNHPQYVVSQTWDGIGMASLIIFDRWYSHFTIGPYTVYIYIYINRYIYTHPITFLVRYFLFGLVTLRLYPAITYFTHPICWMSPEISVRLSPKLPKDSEDGHLRPLRAQLLWRSRGGEYWKNSWAGWSWMYSR
jgi:hypothetical protein